MSDVEQQVRLLNDFSIQCVLIGGFAAFLQGASTLTRDLHICYSREDENLVRVVEALRSVNAVLRGAPREIKFVLDAETLKHGLNFTFATDIGDFDLFGEVPGVGTTRNVYVTQMKLKSLEVIIGYYRWKRSFQQSRRQAGPRTCSHFLN